MKDDLDLPLTGIHARAQGALDADLAALIEIVARIGGLCMVLIRGNALYERALDELGIAPSDHVVAEVRRLAKRVNQLEAENAQLRTQLQTAPPTPPAATAPHERSEASPDPDTRKRATQVDDGPNSSDERE